MSTCLEDIGLLIRYRHSVHEGLVCVGITSSIEYMVGNYPHEERGYIATLGIGVQTSVAF